MTRRKGVRAADDPGMQALLDSGAPVLTIVGKTSDFHVREVLRVSLEENLAMIEKGREIKAVPPAPRRTGLVVDIFAVLKKSLETAGQQKSQTADRGKRKRKA